jgi:hypothetical protein
MELAIEDALSVPCWLSPSLLNIVSISDSLNVREEWEVIMLGPNE